MGWNLLNLLMIASLALTEETEPQLDSDNFLDYLSQQFLDDRSDFSGLEVNKIFFPLAKAYNLTHPDSEESYDEFKNNTAKFAKRCRGFKPFAREESKRLLEDFFEEFALLKQEAYAKQIDSWNNVLEGNIPYDVLYVLPFSIRSMLPLQYPTEVDPAEMALMVQEDPDNFSFLHKIGQLLRVAASDLEREKFVQDTRVNVIDPEMAFILAYRWGVGRLQKTVYTMNTLAKLPVDSVLSVNAAQFEKVDLTERLKESAVFEDVPESKMTAWYLVTAKHMNEAYLKENYDKHKHLLLMAPLDKMIAYMEYKDSQRKADLVTAFDLPAVRVQEIFKNIDLKEMSADDDDVKISNFFFNILHKLDIEQIDGYYGNDVEFSNLYSKRHELEKLWIEGSQNVPWPLLKYVAMKHWPSSAPLSTWTSKQLLIFEKFAFALTLQDLNSIPVQAFMESTVKNMISNKMTTGQLYVIFEKFIEAEKLKELTKFDPPASLYPCLPSSVLSGETEFFQDAKDFYTQEMFMATKRFTPAQIVVFMDVIKSKLWEESTLELILTENLSLLDSVPTWEFKRNLDAFISTLKKLGKTKFQAVSTKIKRMPRRLLNAWLEVTILNPGEKYINVTALLDRPAGVVSGPDARVDLYEQKMEGSLASLALPGLTCNLIEKISPGEIIEVISNYRNSLDEDMIIPSDVRRCFAMMVRKFLALKSALYKLEATSEVELLSLLSTADIRGIGGEVLLTWGQLIEDIVHPEVLYEVYQMIASDVPHVYLHNGVSLTNIKNFAADFHQILVDKHPDADFVVMKKLRDLLPFLDEEVSASADDAKAFVITVLNANPWARSVCIPAANRELLRKLILKGFGNPESWTSLDLVYLGDLLIVMTQEDLNKVSVDSVRRALTELVAGSKYGVLLPEIRGHEEPQLYFEACAAWLNDGRTFEDGEGKLFIDAYERLAHWHMKGAYTITSYIPVVETAVPRLAKRETNEDLQETPEINFKVLHDKVVGHLNEKMKLLTREEKIKIANLYQETKELLGNGTMKLAGHDPTKISLTDKEVLDNIKSAKEGGDLNVDEVVSLALDAQIHLIRELSQILKLTAEDLGISTGVYEELKKRDTFVETERFMATAVYSFTTRAPGAEEVTGEITNQSEGSGSSIAELDEAMQFDEVLKSFNTEAPTTEAATTVGQSAVDVTVTVETAVVRMADVAVKYSCDVIRTAGKSACMILPGDLNNLEDDISNCIEVLGDIDFSDHRRAELWDALKDNLNTGDKIESGSMINLNKFLPEIARSDPDLLDVTPQNLDAVSILGKSSTLLIDKFIKNLGTRALSINQLKSLGRMLCGMTESDWKNRIHKSAYPFLFPHLGEINCHVDSEVSKVLFENLENVLPKYDMVDDDVDHWTVFDQRSSSVMELGWLIGVFPSIHLERAPASSISTFPYSAFINIPDLGIFSPEQLENIDPFPMSLVREEQLGEYLDPQKRDALHAAGGEDPRFLRLMDSFAERVEDLDVAEELVESSTKKDSGGTKLSFTFATILSVLFLH